MQRSRSAVRFDFWFVVLVALVVTSPARRVAADDESDRARGTALYAEGLRQLEAGQTERALRTFDESVRLLPSPNTDLLRGHALRTLGRRVEAMSTYEKVVQDAGARVRGGDKRFEATLADAGRWVAFLRTELGEIVIEVRPQRSGVSVQLDGKPVELVEEAASASLRKRIWREPGRTTVRARVVGESERSRNVVLDAGASESVVFDFTPPRASVPAPSKRDQPRSHAPPTASFVAFGVGAAGFAVLAIAGTLAKSKMSELDECSPRCTQEQADDASKKATIANVGLAVGIAGVVIGGAIWVGSEATRPSVSASIPSSRGMHGISVSGRF